MHRLLPAFALLVLLSAVCPAQPFTGPLLFSRLTVNRTRVAFSYAGDIRTVKRAGGEARRLTYMPEDDLAVGWTPDGKSVLFNSHRDEEGVVRLWKTALDGVTAGALPLPQGYTGSYSPDGARIAYQPMGFAGEYRFYRGGMLSPVWIANLSTGALEKLPHGNHSS